MIESIIKPKRPAGPGWRQVRLDSRVTAQSPYPIEGWHHAENNLFVMSALEVAEGILDLKAEPQYHVSISRTGYVNGEPVASRCTGADAQWVIAQFGIPDALEDNHTPSGSVRHFWRPVADKFSGVECACVDDEPAIKEDKGDFIWRGVPR